MLYRSMVCVLVANFLAITGHADPRIERIRHALLSSDSPSPHARHAYVGSVELPADGAWRIRSDGSDETIRELYLTPDQPAQLKQLGKRMYAAIEERQIQSGRWQVQTGYESCRRYAQDHRGFGPATLTDLDKRNATHPFSSRWDRASWRLRDIEGLVDVESLDGPFIHLIPKAKFRFSPVETSEEISATESLSIRKVVRKEAREILAFQLRPFIDDGKHWVLYTDGNCERVEIDRKLIDAQHVTIRPILAPDKLTEASSRPQLQYSFVVVSDEELVKPFEFEVYNQILDQRLQVVLETTEAKEIPFVEIQDALFAARRYAWKPYLLSGGGGVLRVWDQTREPNRDQDTARNLSMFSILGGRAAIEETLQLQNLAVANDDSQASIDIATLKGVEVRSHPFDEMLAGSDGGQLELADYVPHDRFFVYVGKPEKLPALLDSGAPFIASIGTTLTGNRLHYNLESRYLARLGLTRDWVDSVLASGLTSELAIFTPDLFFIDATDVTVIAKLRQPQLLRQLMGMLGVSGLASQAVLEVPATDGKTAYFALRDNLLFIGTQRDELQQALDLHTADGANSLGQSAEFRYMLTQLPSVTKLECTPTYRTPLSVDWLARKSKSANVGA